MKSVIRYKTKPGRGDENQRLVENVYAELAERDPGGIRYVTLRLEDGLTFIHVFMTDTEDRPSPLGTIAAFNEFQKDLTERCSEQPVAQAMTVVGSYRMW